MTVTEIIRVHVTEEDIKNGKKRTADRCPLALAISRTCGSKAFVGGQSALVLNSYNHYGLPKEAQSFVIDFDRDEKVESFEFGLEKYEEESEDF